MAARPVKPKPATSSSPRTKTASIEPEQAFVDPLADVPLPSLATDQFTIQPDEITLITVGSIEVVTYQSSKEDKIEPPRHRRLASQARDPKDETQKSQPCRH